MSSRHQIRCVPILGHITALFGKFSQQTSMGSSQHIKTQCIVKLIIWKNTNNVET